MQYPEIIGQVSDGGDSPVFFTGCSQDSPKRRKRSDNNTVIDPNTIISSIDFVRLKQSVDLILSQCVAPINDRNVANHVSTINESLKHNPSPVVTNTIATPPVCGNSHINHQQPMFQIPQLHSSAFHLNKRSPRKRRFSDVSPQPVSESFLAPNASFNSSYDEETYDKINPPVANYEKSVPNRLQNREEFDGRISNHKRALDSTSNQNYKRSRMSSPLPSRSRNLWRLREQLTKDIWQLYNDHKQSQTVYDSKMNLRNQLHDILQESFPQCGLFVVGSSMTGLGGDNSDMDMCLMLSGNEIDQTADAPNILSSVYSIFSHYDFLHDLELIPAKVPILRFKDSLRKVEVDLNVNNAVGIRNTQLLKSYARMDERVPPLVLLTKMWAKCHGINDAKNHTLSSYSLVLMVIHYLQYKCRPPVLPCLQRLMPNKFNPFSDVRSLILSLDLPPFCSENSLPLAELFLGFLDYYANEFNYSNDVISVRMGGIVPKAAAMSNTSPKNKRGHWKHISIEEPFDLTNTACSVFMDSAFFYIRDVFLRSWNMLKGSGSLESILDLRRLSFKKK